MQARLFECKSKCGEPVVGMEIPGKCIRITLERGSYPVKQWDELGGGDYQWGSSTLFSKAYTDFRYVSDTPAAEWLEAAKELADVAYRYIAIRERLSSDCVSLGIGSSSADTPRWEIERNSRETELRRVLHRLKPILSPEPSPPAVWEKFADEVCDGPQYANDDEKRRDIARISKEHFAPLQAERDELKRECTELRQEIAVVRYESEETCKAADELRQENERLKQMLEQRVNGISELNAEIQQLQQDKQQPGKLFHCIEREANQPGNWGVAHDAFVFPDGFVAIRPYNGIVFADRCDLIPPAEFSRKFSVVPEQPAEQSVPEPLKPEVLWVRSKAHGNAVLLARCPDGNYRRIAEEGTEFDETMLERCFTRIE